MREFQRVHRATPLLKFWTTILAVFAVIIANINSVGLKEIADFLRGEEVQLWWFAAGIGVFLLSCALVWGISGIWWRAMGFRLGDDEVELKHGVISTTVRSARYERIQSVDVVEPVIARIFRVAKVRIETAGGAGSTLEILYLRKPKAERVCAEVLARARGEDMEERPLTEPVHAALIPEIPIQRSLLAAVIHPASIVVLLSTVFGFVVPGGFGAVIPVFVGLLPWVWGIVDKSWRFTAEVDNDALNVTYGLADKRRQTIPLARIHAVKIAQPVLWRPFNWWSVIVSTAGYGMRDKQAGTSMLLPVGTREQALAMLCVLSPLTEQDVVTHAQPERATQPQYRSPKSAWWVSPIDQGQQAVTLLGERAVVTHSGRFGHRMSVIAPEHIQELSLQRGPIAQGLGLADVRFDLVPGPVQMSGKQLLLADAQQLLEVLRKRALPSIQNAISSRH
ncbi:PH domain-containing protein [Corynebacterium sp. H128]|uniref:PH domain-containing protein n=1 Tax=Corynebacterium sp. H128 TaxID=3133427 RepID=UPI0030A9BE5E